eukprot:1157575-Pelagomonas_calceolata.AAC.1
MQAGRSLLHQFGKREHTSSKEPYYVLSTTKLQEKGKWGPGRIGNKFMRKFGGTLLVQPSLFNLLTSLLSSPIDAGNAPQRILGPDSHRSNATASCKLNICVAS